jgi:hypothetical protein
MRQCRSRPRPSFSDRIADDRAATALRPRKPNGPQAAALFCGDNPVRVDYNVAQPALSLHIRNMEADLGVPLLFRTSQGVQPTEAGQILMATRN